MLILKLKKRQRKNDLKNELISFHNVTLILFRNTLSRDAIVSEIKTYTERTVSNVTKAVGIKMFDLFV